MNKKDLEKIISPYEVRIDVLRPPNDTYIYCSKDDYISKENFVLLITGSSVTEATVAHL